jgi:hypothetical protein
VEKGRGVEAETRVMWAGGGQGKWEKQGRGEEGKIVKCGEEEREETGW